MCDWYRVKIDNGREGKTVHDLFPRHCKIRLQYVWIMCALMGSFMHTM